MVRNASRWTWRAVAISAFAAVAVAAGCSSSTAPNEVRLDATSLTAPATIAANAPLSADVVVERGAYESFDRFDVVRSGSQIMLTAIGRDVAPRGAVVRRSSSRSITRTSRSRPTEARSRSASGASTARSCRNRSRSS